MRERLDGRDRKFLLVCAAVAGASILVIVRYFASAFPEAALEFKYDRGSSRAVAERVLNGQHLALGAMKHTVVFDADDNAKIFLERSLGLERAGAVLRRDVHVWSWHHRWFRPLQEEEYAVDIAPTGELVAYSRRLPEAAARPSMDSGAARAEAERFLARNGIDVRALQLVAESERQLPNRLQRIFTWESRTTRPAGAPYRYELVVDGDAVGSFAQRLRVPEEWQRAYAQLRSKNLAAGNADLIFLGITIVAALVVFVIRLRRGDLPLRMLFGIGAVTVVLVLLNAINSYPSAVAGYSTTSSFAAFVFQFGIGTILQCLGSALFLMVLAGAGEVLYRERLPQHLALPRLWSPRALTSRRVFRAFILGYTMVAFFIAYQVAFYVIAARFGAWSPAETPYDDTLNSALPWVAVLFAGWVPALSEELMSRAFSLPFVEKLLHSRVAAIVLSGFVWGFGHAAYPNQPFFIRGLEVGLAGCVIGVLFYRFGLLPLLIWHYTVDALYTSLLLLRSHNTYYIVSGGLAALVFAIPMLISIGAYFRKGGFEPDDDLSNETLPLSAPPPAALEQEIVHETAPLPPAAGTSPARLVACIVLVAIAAALLLTRGPAPDDAIDYRITRDEAKAVATQHLTSRLHQPMQTYVIAAPLEGFRDWDRNSGREDGGGPGGFDSIAADYLVSHGMTTAQLVETFRNRVQAGTWTIRFFTPHFKVEEFVEVDPRTFRPIGHHQYQDERAPGPRLEEAQAIAIANGAFAVYGIDPATFDLKEALAFQQPARRDWLFHFQERQPLAAEAFRRITVRVSGAEVTQFTTTIKVPDRVYREAERETVLNVVLFVLRIAGSVLLLAFVVTGVVIVMRHGRVRWKRAGRWTLALAIVPIVAAMTGYESRLFGYSTSIRWTTFQFDLAVDLIRSTGLQLGVVFLAVAALDAAFPHALSLLSREGRAGMGRAAAVAALTAVALFIATRGLLQRLASFFPAMAGVPSIDAPSDVAIRLPGLVAILQAGLAAVVISAAVALYAIALRTLPNQRWSAPLVTILGVAVAVLDPGAPMHSMPLMLARALLLGATIWIIARYVTVENLLAVPLAIFTLIVVSNAATLAHNHRPDLLQNAIAEVVVLAGVYLWIVLPRRVDA